MKRSGREARWADIPSARTRFTAEAAFLILVAGGAALARLSPLSIIVLMLVAWLLVALIERASSREQASALAGANEASRTDETEVLPVPEPEPEEEVVEAPAPAAQPKPRVAFRWLFWRRVRTAVVALPEPTASLEERPSRSHVTRIEAEPPPPVIEVETIVTEIVVTEIPAPGPSVTKRPLDLPGLEEPETARAAAPPPPEAPVVEPPVEPPRVERAPEPRPVERVPPPPPPQPPPAPPLPRPPAREWNIWDLEKRARQQAGDPLRDEQWGALFMNLRQYANADGVLPKEFDELVRESFSELIQAA